jgi:hypothetical protein
MKKLFQIENSSRNENIQPVLAMRIGKSHCSFTILELASKEVKQLFYFTTDNADETFLEDLFRNYPELSGTYYQVLVCFDHPDGTLVPLKYFNHDDAALLLEACSGTTGPLSVVSEVIPEWQTYAVYAVPLQVYDWVKRKFPNAKFWHFTSVGLKKIKPPTVGPSLVIDFRIDDFTLYAYNDNRLLLVQTYTYSTPEDVIYCLLNICSQLSLQRSEVTIHLSGLIDRHSNLYKDLHQYFPEIIFREGDWKLPEQENPPHFFTSLNDLLLCAS